MNILSRPKLRPELDFGELSRTVEGRSGGRIEACPEPVEGGWFCNESVSVPHPSVRFVTQGVIALAG
jgi:hypothetical protein